MKIVQINTTCGVGSTGKICVSISEILSKKGIENYIFYSGKGNGYSFGIKYSNKIYKKFQALASRIFGNYGFNSRMATHKIIKYLDEIKPDIVHLHNIHGHDCDLKTLFNYFKKNKIKLVWTFHDCWAFTGYCTHFDAVKCNRWQTECRDCPQRKEYSWFVDKSKELFQRKKELFEGLDMIITAPSKWLAEKVKKSFFNGYKTEVINNGIDLTVFKPTESDFREKNKLEDKKIVLGVAFDWGERKGLDVFVELSKRLPEHYQIVLVGTNKKIDEILPGNIISIHRTQNQQELAEIYTEADVFVNPTREEVFGLVNVEALACGTPVITFNTGGSPECIDTTCGTVVPKNDIDTMLNEIIKICEEKSFEKENCINYAKNFEVKKTYEEYIKLYERIAEERI